MGGRDHVNLDCRPRAAATVQDCAQKIGTSAALTQLPRGPPPEQKEETLDRETYQRGLQIRSEVLGEEYVNRALANADEFTGPLQDLVTEYCWGTVWGREELPRKIRSMLNLAMISVLNRPNELRTHVKAALTNGVTREEIREVFLQVAIYAGVPAAVDSFRIANDAFAELDRDRGDR